MRSKITHKHLKVVIEYVVPFDSLNLEEVLDRLREYGSAEVIDASIVDEVKGQGCFCDPSKGECDHE